MPDTASSASLHPDTTAVPPVSADHRPALPPSSLAPSSMPPQARILFDRLARAADRGEPCPSNFALMDALDLASPDGIRKHMGQLRAAGLVRVESAGQRRRVEIVASGRRTDWSRSGGNARAGAMFSDGWGNGSDALLLRMAAQGLDLATMATRLGRTASSVRHRLRRLRAAGRIESPAAEVLPESAPSPPTAPAALPDPGPMRRDVVTTDRDRPTAETAQIAALLARGGGRKVPPAYAGEVRGATPLAGIAPISPRARRVLRSLDENHPRPARVVALTARLDPLLMPEVLHELKTAGLAVRHAGAATRRNRADAGYARTPAGTALARALGLPDLEAPS